ncbi:MAG: hypothetical protein IT381_16060 [Deltaproteobacteria bacterium]|nr:hypothetical protein [Deltaproteobacteria bacterium]
MKRSLSRKEQVWRLESAAGPVYVLRPGGYRPERGGVVVYVHGLFNDVDSAWSEHALQQQFVESNRNAIYVVPEAPVQPPDFVRWASLEALLDFVEVKLPGVLPNSGPTIAMGHSGAYRTIVEWLDEPRLQEVVLVDGLYGNEDDFATWAQSVPERRMLISVLTTQKWAEPFLARFPDAFITDKFPRWVWPEPAKSAKIVAINSDQYKHMELVTGGKVLPVMLRLTSLQRRRDSW